MNENEWVRLSRPYPKTLPAGTMFKDCGDEYTLIGEATLIEDRIYRGPTNGRAEGEKSGNEWSAEFPGRVYKLVSDDLGDTPAHLRELLREARTAFGNTVVLDDGVTTLFRWHEGALRGWSVFGASDRKSWIDGTSWPADNAQDGDRARLKRAIQAGRVYPTADARRIGREEFGMVFDGDPGTPGDMLANMPPMTIIGRDGKGQRVYYSQEELDRDFGVGRFQFTAFVPESSAPIASVEVRDLRPTCSQCSTHMDPRHDGDDTCSAECHQAKLGKRREQERAMKYEASEHVYRKVRAYSYFHGLVQRNDDDARRAQLRADMDRPLPRVNIEHAEPLNRAALPGVCGVRGKRGGPVKAPSTWPEDAGWDDV